MARGWLHVLRACLCVPNSTLLHRYTCLHHLLASSSVLWHQRLDVSDLLALQLSRWTVTYNFFYYFIVFLLCNGSYLKCNEVNYFQRYILSKSKITDFKIYSKKYKYTKNYSITVTRKCNSLLSTPDKHKH